MMIEKEVATKLDCIERVIESPSEDRRKIKLENEELRVKLEEERKEKRIVEMNWKKLRKEMEIEHQIEETFDITLARGVDRKKVDNTS